MRRFHFDTTDSTNARAAALAAQYPDQSLLVTADAQAQGRGRHDRPWQSPHGGVWFTLAWPSEAEAGAIAALPVRIGLAVIECIERCIESHGTRATSPNTTAASLALKWPNDVLCDGHKLAGILCEQYPPVTARRRLVLIGVGINANFDADALGSDLRYPPTSLRTWLGADIDRTALLDACVAHMTETLERFETVGLDADTLTRLNDRLAWRGQRVVLERIDQPVTGLLTGIDEHGRVCIDGQAYDVGEMNHIAPAIEA